MIGLRRWMILMSDGLTWRALVAHLMLALPVSVVFIIFVLMTSLVYAVYSAAAVVLAVMAFTIIGHYVELMLSWWNK